ncbi:ferric reductase-like transmembrane domain-containing protein [Limnoraphis robusta]|uniref:Ferric reductase-like transmembrane domain-containing protein n=1 Tax=Limnoraphis robusta CCNP1315 TaxID=3110306 RepID=A0ABU5U7Z0_9CYAN|nr:ferric reductase-like transmembrane domain-containing protein [Limnoraphis robusta]MEA5522972.1 ferric reductase-like transmembrane domain-containing protein [Limnoraphis robusta CCNP1315]MEA5545015.1 ferric reductase-like transmembrane domain-containing protein [Limnoraphis robusta CCNP1324]
MFTLDTPSLPHVLGILALISYVITLSPTILRIVFPQTRQTGIPKILLKQRRLIGIISFGFAIAHGYLLVRQRSIDLFDLKTSWIYIQGVLTFTIFAILAITSNDWSVKKLKKNWKKIHQLTYFAIFLLTWHVWDKMSGHWTYITPIAMILMTGTTVLFLVRMWMENKGKNKPKKPINQKAISQNS